jgi:hypothetical protein
MCRPCFISLLPLLLRHDSPLFFEASQKFIFLQGYDAKPLPLRNGFSFAPPPLGVSFMFHLITCKSLLDGFTKRDRPTLEISLLCPSFLNIFLTYFHKCYACYRHYQWWQPSFNMVSITTNPNSKP